MSHLASNATTRRLVILANYGGPYAGTFVSMVRAIVREARQRGWFPEIVFCSNSRGRTWLAELIEDNVPCRFAPTVESLALRRWIIDEVLSDVRPTVLHTHFTTFDVPSALASRGRPGVAVFWHIHSNASKRPSVRFRNMLKYGVVGHLVQKILCVAPNIAGEVRSRGASAKRVLYIPNAIDTSRFPLTSPEDRLSARRHLGLSLDARILLHFGWDWQRKGGDVFLRTVSALLSAGAPVIGVTVGGGDRARSAVAEQGLTQCIRVLEPANDVRVLYAAADVFLSPSVAEGMPFAMAEALCTGLAVVGSDIPGQAVIAEQIRACRLTALNPDALATAVRAMLSRDDNAVVSERTQAREELVRRFDLVPWAKTVVDFYSAALDGTLSR